MQTMVPLYGFGGGSGGSGEVLTVHAPAGCTVTLTKDGKSRTNPADSSGTAVFRGLDDGTWEITISDGSRQYARTVEVSANYQAAMEFFAGYLYQDGNEYPGITGGWCGDDEFLMKQERCLSMQVSDGACGAYLHTRLPFDFTNYTRMTLRCAFGAYAYGDTLTFGVMSEHYTTIASVTREYDGETETGYADMELDIRGVVGDCFPFVKIQTSDETAGVVVSVASLKVE